MYEFIGPKEVGLQGTVPSDNMSINGRYLNDIFTNYHQLHVEGRGLVEREIKSDSVPRRDGIWLDYIQDKERYITVTYYLENNTSEEIREFYKYLNLKLRQGLLKLTFNDESDWYYEAFFIGGDSPSENTLNFIGTLNFICPSPRKKSHYLYKSDRDSLNFLSYPDILPAYITATIDTTSNHLEIVSGDKRIVVDGAYDAGKEIKVDFSGEDMEIYYEGRSILDEVALHSDLENFYLDKNTEITGVGVTIKEFAWRDESI